MKQYIHQNFPESITDDFVIDALREFQKNIPIQCGVRKYHHDDGGTAYEIVFPDGFLLHVKEEKLLNKIKRFIFSEDSIKITFASKGHIDYNYCFGFLHGFDSYEKVLEHENRKARDWYENRFQSSFKGQYRAYKGPTPNQITKEPPITSIEQWFKWAMANITQKERKRKFANHYHPDRQTGDARIFKIYWTRL